MTALYNVLRMFMAGSRPNGRRIYEAGVQITASDIAAWGMTETAEKQFLAGLVDRGSIEAVPPPAAPVTPAPAQSVAEPPRAAPEPDHPAPVHQT